MLWSGKAAALVLAVTLCVAAAISMMSLRSSDPDPRDPVYALRQKEAHYRERARQLYMEAQMPGLPPAAKAQKLAEWRTYTATADQAGEAATAMDGARDSRPR